jgi:VanZ family protein
MNIIVHICGYLIIGMFVTRLVGYSTWKSFVVTLAIAVLDESLQVCCMANRTGEITDILVDMGGGWTLGYLIACEISEWWRENYTI